MMKRTFSSNIGVTAANMANRNPIEPKKNPFRETHINITPVLSLMRSLSSFLKRPDAPLPQSLCPVASKWYVASSSLSYANRHLLQRHNFIQSLSQLLVCWNHGSPTLRTSGVNLNGWAAEKDVFSAILTIEFHF